MNARKIQVAARCFCGAGWNVPAKECSEGHPMSPAEAEVMRLRDELASCIQFAAEGWAYASPYFAEKWEYGKRMACFALAIENPRPTSPLNTPESK